MKICVIGDSHAAAIKLAYDQMAREPSMPELTFFADRGAGIAYLVAQDGVLRAVKHNHQLRSALQFTSDGLSNIDPKNYDRFLILGLAKNIGRLVPVHRMPISMSARNCAIRDFWAGKAISEMLLKLRSLTDKPISYGLTPLLAAEKANENGTDAYEKLLALSDDLFFRELNVSLVGQPLQTIVNENKTKLAYSNGSLRLRVDEIFGKQVHPVEEVSHMNEAYGALWLKGYLDSMSGACGT